jgi:hypothetical protein
MSDIEFEVLNANVRKVMETTAGKDVIWEILSMCGLYTDNSIEVNPAIEGKRAIGLQILGLLTDADEKIYPQLLLMKQEEDNARNK